MDWMKRLFKKSLLLIAPSGEYALRLARFYAKMKTPVSPGEIGDTVQTDSGPIDGMPSRGMLPRARPWWKSPSMMMRRSQATQTSSVAEAREVRKAAAAKTAAKIGRVRIMFL